MSVYWLICFYKEGLGGTFAFSSRQKAVDYRLRIRNKIDHYFIYTDEIGEDDYQKIKFDDEIIVIKKGIKKNENYELRSSRL